MNRELIIRMIRQFIMGGTIIATTSYIAVYLNPTLAAIFWSFPMSMIPVIIFMWMTNQPRSKIGDYSLSTTISLINLGLFTLFFGYLMKYSKKFNILEALIISTIVWAIGSFLLYYFYLSKY